MKHQDENLSLLLDDDSEADVNAVLDEVMADVNLQYRVRRYQIIGEVLRNELPQAIDTDFHHGVMARIREQSANLEAHEKHSELGRDRGNIMPVQARAWFRPFAGLAVAASVAVVTVALWQPLQQQGALPNDGLASADQQKADQQKIESSQVNRLWAARCRFRVECKVVRAGSWSRSHPCYSAS